MATFAGRYDEPMLRRVNGRLGVATGITVRVYESNGTTVATLYTDRTKATTADNPVAVDASGNLEFFADPGTYVLSILESDAQVATNVVSVHADPAEPVDAGDHTQTASTITDLTEAIQDAVGAMATDSTTVNFTYDDGAGTLTAVVQGLTTSDVSGLSEAIDDRVSGLLVAGTNITLTYDDTANTLTIAAAGANLTWTAATSTVASDTGTDAVLTVVDGSNPGLMSVAQFTKLAGIETAATADQTAAELLTAIKTVDGSGSGLDADTVDGIEGAVLAPLASPTFTGTPAAPTAAPGTNTTQVATTAFVATASGAYLAQDLSTLTASTAPDADDLVYVWLDGAARKVAVSDLVAFVLANPTLTGTVTVPDGALAIADTNGLQTALDAKVAQAQAVNAQTGTSYTLVAGDAGKLVTLSNASAVTLTVPQDSDATIAVGSYIDLMALGAGQVTVVAGTGATLRVSGLTAKSRAQYARLGLQKVSANTFSLFGDLAAS